MTIRLRNAGKRIRRFLRDLRRDRTDIWDWKTYGRPGPRLMFQLLRDVWEHSGEEVVEMEVWRDREW